MLRCIDGRGRYGRVGRRCFAVASSQVGGGGGWTKPTFKSVGNGSICIALSTDLAIRWISCSPQNVTMLLRDASSNEQSGYTTCRRRLPSTRAALILRQ